MTTTQNSLWLTGPTARRSPSCGRTDFRRRAAGAEQVHGTGPREGQGAVELLPL